MDSTVTTDAGHAHRPVSRRAGNAPRRSRRFIAGISLLFALSAFVAHLGLELRLNELQAFEQRNLFFDSDPNEVLDTFAAGGYLHGGDRQGFVHPGMRVFFTAPIKAAAIVIAGVSGDSADIASWRLRLALLVTPICAALFYVVFLNTLLQLGFSTVDSCVLTILAFLSFSQLLFGSIPESFPISNLAIAMAFLLFVLPGQRTAWRTAAWVAVGAFTAGVTITNIVPVAILLWLDGVSAGMRLMQSARRTIGLAVLAVGLILSVNVITNRAVGIQRAVSSETSFITRFTAVSPRVIVLKALTFPAVLVNTFVAPMTTVVPDPFDDGSTGRYPFRLTFDFDWGRGTSTRLLSFRNTAGAAVVLILLLAVYRMPRDSFEERRLYLVCCAGLMVIAFNWAFHSFWGVDRYLYSQHWDVALKLLLAGVIRAHLPSSNRTTAVVAALTLFVGWNNGLVLGDVLQMLKEWPPI